MTHPDIRIATAIELASAAVVGLIKDLPDVAEILAMPVPPWINPRSWDAYRLEEAVAAVRLWHVRRFCGAKAALDAWDELVALRWALVSLVRFERKDADQQGSAVLACYHAACLYDRQAGRRFVTYAKYWMNKSDQLHHAAMSGPTRVPKEAYAKGERAVGISIPSSSAVDLFLRQTPGNTGRMMPKIRCRRYSKDSYFTWT